MSTPIRSKWLSPGATGGYWLLFSILWLAVRRIFIGRWTIFFEESAITDAIVLALAGVVWLVYVQIRAGRLAGEITSPHDQLDVESKQQTAFLTGLAIIATTFTGIVNAPALVSSTSANELFLIGSGTVVDFLAGHYNLPSSRDFIVGNKRLRVRVIEAGSDDGLGIMASAYNHGRGQEGQPLILGMASYGLGEQDPILQSDARPSVFFRIELTTIDTIFVIRTRGVDGPPPEEADKVDPLQFLAEHRAPNVTVFAGQPASGTRRELERITEKARGISPSSCRALWTQELGTRPTSLDLDAIPADQPSVLFGSNFRATGDRLLDSSELRELAETRGWSVVPLFVQRPLLLVGRLQENNRLPLEVCLFLQAIGWADEGVDLTSRKVNRWTRRLMLLEVEPGHP